MSYKSHVTPVSVQPRRALYADFTTRTLRHAVTAKRRANAKQHIKTFFKEPLSMESRKFLRTVPGAILAIAIVATTSASAYALTNWFNGDVTVQQTDSVLSVDLSQCKGNLPPGIDSSADKHNVQFKILGAPHISNEQLQRRLLAECEYNAVVDFYRNTLKGKDYAFYPSIIKAVDANGAVTLDYFWGGQTVEKTFVAPSDATMYDQGQKIGLHDLQAGSMAVFAVETPYVAENTDPLAAVNEVKSIFKTQYDTREAPGADKNAAFYERGNIMPLDMYKSLR